MLRKKAKSGGRKIERELTQEEILLEAEETEKLNMLDLKKYEQMELENKRRAVRLTKRVVKGACIRYRSVAMPLISAQNSNTQGNLLKCIVIWLVRREGIEHFKRVSSSLCSNTLFSFYKITKWFKIAVFIYI